MNPQGAHLLGYGPQYAQTISRASNLQQIYPPGQLATMDQRQQLARTSGYYVEPAGCQPYESLAGLFERQAALNRPLCRCRVMYLGSSVPHITKNGLHGIQEPLRHLYPEEQFHGGAQAAGEQTKGGLASQTIDISHLSSGLGIDSWLSVWSNGILLQNVDEFGREIRRFFSIESLHYCAAVRYFDTAKLKGRQPASSGEPDEIKVIEEDQNNNSSNSNNNSATASDQNDKQRPVRGPVRFLPLDAPLFRWPGMLDPSHPPVFAAIMRRTSGIKVLECHAFICRRDAAANALVRCCTHAYGDFLSAKRLSMELAGGGRATMTLGRQQRRRARGQPERPPVRAAGPSSAGQTASSSAGDDSLEQSNSSEDNYAIISKPGAAIDSAGRRRAAGERRARGSSRSLFTDFMPELEEPARPARLEKGGGGRLSRSSDQLADLCRLDCCVGRPAAGEQSRPHAQYSVVRGKRHSRSMQNLEQPCELARPVAESGPKQARTPKSRASRRAANTDKGRKAASCQDMRREPPANWQLEPKADTSNPKRQQQRAGQAEAPSGARSRRRHERARRDCCPRDSSQRPPVQQPSLHQQPHLAGPPAAFYPSCCPPAPPVGQPLYASTGAYLPAYYVPGPQMYAAGPLASPIYVEPPHFEHTIRPAASKHSLARFRCLSPPANLLSESTLAAHHKQQQQQQQPPTSNQPDPTKSSKGRRLSWIKRLSLTLSSASGSTSIQMEPEGQPAQEAAGRPASGSSSKPKRSSLFAGSLTLGRSRPHAKLVAGA